MGDLELPEVTCGGQLPRTVTSASEPQVGQVFRWDPRSPKASAVTADCDRTSPIRSSLTVRDWPGAAGRADSLAPASLAQRGLRLGGPAAERGGPGRPPTRRGLGSDRSAARGPQSQRAGRAALTPGAVHRPCAGHS
eukprot:764608-Hanusia_phi.AAC.1